MSKKQKTRVIIVGGGFGGVKTALELANKPHFEVTLISDGTNFEYHGALYRTATGNSPMEVVIPLREIFARVINVSVVLDQAQRLDPDIKVVRSSTGNSYAYDKLVLALGNNINYFGLADMDKKTFSINSVKQAISLRHELVAQLKADKKVSVVVIGGGPTGVELAGEIGGFARRVSQKYQKRYYKPRVTLIEGQDRVLPMFDLGLSAKASKRLRSMGVQLKLGVAVEACSAGSVRLSSGSVDADIIVWTAGSKLPDFYQLNSSLFKLERGRVAVDDQLQANGLKDVFVIGDNAATPYSGMAQTALYDAKFVASNLQRAISGRKAKLYRPRRPIYVVPVGKSWAVYQVGRRRWSGQRAWLMRRRADLAILRNFAPYKQALKQWRKANRQAKY